MNEQDYQKLNETIALGALKYYILKVDPKKRMLFNPEESIDFNGKNTTLRKKHFRFKNFIY